MDLSISSLRVCVVRTVLRRSAPSARAILSTLAAPAIVFAGLTLAPKTAHAQQYVVVRPEPPPPPPPPPRAYVYTYPGAYYYGPPPPRRVYYADRESPYALQIGADLEGAVPVGVNVPGNSDTLKGGGGFKLRIGEQIRFPGIRLTPEGGFGYDHLWANDALGNTFGWDMNRLFAGARLSFGNILVPVIYGHVGYGWRQTGDTNVSTSNSGGFAYDVGGALDLRIIPHFGIGAHIEYSAIDIPFQPQWVAAGLHADLVF